MSLPRRDRPRSTAATNLLPAVFEYTNLERHVFTPMRQKELHSLQPHPVAAHVDIRYSFDADQRLFAGHNAGGSCLCSADNPRVHPA